MLRTVLLAALALACLSSVAEARPRHASQRSGVVSQQVAGCSDPVMRPCEKKVDHRHKVNKIRHKSHILSDFTTGHNRPRAWCGWWLSRHLGMTDRRLWRALEWRHVGRAAHGPAVGAIVVWARGKGRGHVGIITGKTSRGWVVLSGNDGNAVRERVRSVAGAVAFRWP